MLKNWIKTVLLLGVLTGILLAIGQFFGGSQGLMIALLFSVLMNVGSYWFSDKIVLAIYRAKPAPKNSFLHDLVEDVAKKAGLPKPKVYIIPTQSPNAFATGRNPENAVVACREGILSVFSRDELRGVLAHEMSHVKNRDTLVTTIAATIAGVISYIAHFAMFFGGSRDEDRNPLALLLLVIVTPIVAMLIQLAISRSREFLADETGARTIKDSKSLASALKKLEVSSRITPFRNAEPATSSLFIVNPFSAKGLTGLLSTHPSTEERVKRLNSLNL